MKIDLHVHARERSACSIAEERQLIESAIRFGLEGLVFTDHHRLVPLDHLEKLNEEFAPFRIFGGIEVTVEEGEDILVLGLREPELETRKWTVAELHQLVYENNAWMALAHPFRYRDEIGFDIDAYPPHAIELHSANTPPDKRGQISRLISRLGCRAIWTSDAHSHSRVGLYYIDLPRDSVDETELLRMLKAGEYSCAARGIRVADMVDDI